MTYLAKVARADAIAVILQMKGEGYVTYVAHNLPTDTRWSEGLPSVMLAKAMSERATDQATSGVTLTLSDGRAADTLAVSPVIWKDQVVGGLAAVLAGRAFSAEDLSSLSRVGDLIGLELAEANALWRARRHSSPTCSAPTASPSCWPTRTASSRCGARAAFRMSRSWIGSGSVKASPGRSRRPVDRCCSRARSRAAPTRPQVNR